MDEQFDVPATTATPLSEEERAAIFRAGAPVDRNARRRGGKSPIPPKAVAWLLVAFVILGLGGEAGEHYFGNFGVSSATSTKFLPSNATLAPVRSVNSLTDSQFIGLKEISNAKAPTFTLLTQNDKRWSLSKQGNKVVVLLFEDATCNDICPVLGSEVRQARSFLGVNARSVVFAIVNTDPRYVGVNPKPLALVEPELLGQPGVVFLTGSLHKLNEVWIDYGIRIKVGAKSNEVTHNNVIYFIGPHRQLEALATPFASLSTKGTYSLRSDYVTRFAKGVAQTTDSLI